MSPCKHGHVDGALHTPCYECKAEYWKECFETAHASATQYRELLEAAEQKLASVMEDNEEFRDRLSCEICDKDLTTTSPDGSYCVPVCVECHNKGWLVAGAANGVVEAARAMNNWMMARAGQPSESFALKRAVKEYDAKMQVGRTTGTKDGEALTQGDSGTSQQSSSDAPEARSTEK